MSKKTSKKTRVFLVLFVLLSLLVYFESRREQSLTLRILLGGTELSTEIKNKLSSYWSSYVALIGVQQDNQRLKAQLAIAAVHQFEIDYLAKENARLRALLNWKQKYKPKFILAQVIAFDPLKQSQVLWIDQGAKMGIALNAPVLSAGALVGRVVKLLPNRAQVLLLTDPNSIVDVRMGPSSLRALLVGKKRILAMERQYYLLSPSFFNQPHSEDRLPKQGDLVESSGLDSFFFPGIPVGRITSLKPLEIDPVADFLNLREVLVVVK